MNRPINLLYVFIRFFGRISSNKNKMKFIRIRNVLYSYKMSSLFKEFTQTTRLHYPSSIDGAENISIGNNSGVGAFSIISAWNNYMEIEYKPEIKIGDNVWIGENAHITSINEINIGNSVLFGKNVTITDNSHGDTTFDNTEIAPARRLLFSKGPVIINDNVWVGDKVTILPNVTIGRNSIIGANSVVTKDVPENSVFGGNPAKLIKSIK